MKRKEDDEEIADGDIHEVETEDELKKVLSSKEPTVVLFFLTWCGHCKETRPVFSDLSKDKKDVKFVKVDVDKVHAPSDLQFDGFPSYVVVKDGKVKKKGSGASADKTELKKKLFGGGRTRSRRMARRTRKSRK